MLLTAAWQLFVVVLAGLFVFARARAHDRGLAWVAPPVAAIIGNAISAQLGAGRIAREALR